MSESIPDRLRQVERDINTLHHRLLELEAAIGLMRGTLERAREDETEDAPAVMTFVKPNAPR